MNAAPTVRLPATLRSPAHREAVTPARHERPGREFGIGYGRSSGYGTTRRYTSDWGLARFRTS